MWRVMLFQKFTTAVIFSNFFETLRTILNAKIHLILHNIKGHRDVETYPKIMLYTMPLTAVPYYLCVPVSTICNPYVFFMGQYTAME